MDAAAVLEAVRDADPATTGEIARALGSEPDAVEERLSELASAGRLGRGGGEWRLARDPRLDGSVEHMADRLGREGERR